MNLSVIQAQDFIYSVWINTKEYGNEFNKYKTKHKVHINLACLPDHLHPVNYLSLGLFQIKLL